MATAPVFTTGTLVGSYTVTATASGVSASASFSLTNTAGAAAAITATAGTPQSAVVGTPFATALETKVKDQYGNPVSGVSVTFAAPVAGPDGSFGGSATTAAITNSLGVATAPAFTANTLVGTYTVTATVSGVSSGASFSLTDTAGPAASVTAAAGTPQSTVVGTAFASALQATVEDQYGNPVSGVSVTFTGPTTGPGGSFGGSIAITATTNALGVATAPAFTAKTLAGSYTVNATVPNVSAGASFNLTQTAGAADQVVFGEQPTSGIAGVAFSASVTVEVEDQYDNVVNTDSSIVTMTLSSGTFAGGSSVLTAMASNGVATFSGLTVDGSGTYALSATDSTLAPSGPSDSFTISPGAPYQLAIHTQPSATAMVGQPFATQPVIYEEDRFGNLETGDNRTRVSVALATGVGPLQGQPSVELQGGVATFSGLADNTAETISLNFSGGGFRVGPTTSIVVNPLPVEHLVIHTEPSSTATAGQAFATGPVIYIEDQNGNLETSDNSTVVTVSLESGAGPLQGTESVTAEGGIATFNNLYDDLAETITLEFQSGSLPALTSSPIKVVAAPATKLAIVAQPPASVSAGAGFGFQVVAKDPFGNVDKTYTGPVIVVVGTNPSGSTLAGTTTVTAVSGIATFSGLSLNKAGAGYTLKVSSGSLTGATTSPFSVAAALAPIVSAEQVVPAYKLNKKGKPQGNPISWAFELEYSTTMAATAGLAANYQIEATTIKRGKTSRTPVTFTETYNKSKNTVTLTVSGKNPFANGGQINILASSKSGVSSQSGVLLSSKYTTFTISPGGSGISLG